MRVDRARDRGGGGRRRRRPAAAAQPTCTNAAVTCVTGTAADGSTYKAEVPSPWNGTLLLYSHGYRPPIGPNPPADTWGSRRVADELLARGYALAGSSYAHERLGGRGARCATRSICSTASSGRFGEAAPVDRVGRVDGRHDHRRARRAASAALRRRAAVLRHPRRRGRAVEPEPRPRVRDQDAARRPTRTRPSRCPASQLELVNITDWPANVARANAAVAAAQATPEGRARLALAAALFTAARLVTSPARARPGPRRLRGARSGRSSSRCSSSSRSSSASAQDVEQRAGGNPSWNAGVDYGRLLARSASRDVVGAMLPAEHARSARRPAAAWRDGAARPRRIGAGDRAI